MKCRLCLRSSLVAADFNEIRVETHLRRVDRYYTEYECVDTAACLKRRSCESCGKPPYKHAISWTDSLKDICGKRICDECSYKFKYSVDYAEAFNLWFNKTNSQRISGGQAIPKNSVEIVRST